jgi:hypothetical protein
MSDITKWTEEQNECLNKINGLKAYMKDPKKGGYKSKEEVAEILKTVIEEGIKKKLIKSNFLGGISKCSPPKL